jgi:hypothetical protein
MDAGDVVVPEPVWDELAQKDEADRAATTIAGVARDMSSFGGPDELSCMYATTRSKVVS